jgi:hypothetical protein
MAWKVEGTYLENCNCELVCPCTISFFGQPADNERCLATFLFHVESGDADGVDLGGLTVAIVIDGPQMMGDGNWRVGVLMDDKASEEQAQKLGAIFGGQAGGPMEPVAGLVGENLGVESVPIEFTREDGRVYAKAGNAVEVELETLHLGESEEPVQISGLAFPSSTVTAARPKRSRISAFGVDVSNDENKNAFWAPFSWSG